MRKVCALRNRQKDALLCSLRVEVLLQLLSQVDRLHPNYIVISRVEICPPPHHRLGDFVLSRRLLGTKDGGLCDILKHRT